MQVKNSIAKSESQALRILSETVLSVFVPIRIAAKMLCEIPIQAIVSNVLI
jgi:hypothetical protein